MPAMALENFNNPFTPDANTRGLWHFDETTGSSTFSDAGTNGNNGTLITGFINGWTSDPFEMDPAKTWTTGMPGFGNCAVSYYNSASDYNYGSLIVPQDAVNDSLAFGPGVDMTIEFWMHPFDAGGSWGSRIVKKYTGGDYSVNYQNSNLSYGWYMDGAWRSFSDTFPIAANEWTHVAIVVDRTTDYNNDIISFYINGYRSTSHTTPYKGGNWNTQDLSMFNDMIGPLYTPRQFYGMLDEVRISDCIRDYGGDPALTTVKFSQASTSSDEQNAETINIQLTVTSASTETVTVPYTYTGTATENLDFTTPTPSSPLVFAPGETTKTIQLSILDDEELEGMESLTIALGQPQNANLGDPSSHEVIINDDDINKPAAVILKEFASVGENEGALEFEVILSRPSSQTVTVPFTLAGTAAGGTDYSAPASPLTFAPFETSKTVQLNIVNDSDVEDDETIILSLGAPTGASLSKKTVQRTAIIDDDSGAAVPPDWSDNFYPFRVPITITVPAAGEHTINLTQEMITGWLNEAATFQFSSKYFDYDSVKLVEVDAQGNTIDDQVDAAYYIRIGNEMITNGGFENGTTGWGVTHPAFVLSQTSYDGSWCMTVTGADRNSIYQNFTPPLNTWYKFSAWKLGGASVAPEVSRTMTSGWQSTQHTTADSYKPENNWYKQEYFFFTGDKADWTGGDVSVRMERFTGSADDISVKECEVQFVLNASSAGTKRYMLYYSPPEAITYHQPAPERSAAFPGSTLSVTRDGAAEWLDEGIEYSIASTSSLDIWYAATTRKVLQDAAPPVDSRAEITIACAKNESEALQIVCSPKASGQISSVSASLTGPGSYTLAPEQFDIRQAKYIPINTPSQTGFHYLEPNRAQFTGNLPDALPTFGSVTFSSSDPNILIWVDIKIPATAPAGLYTGSVTINSSTGTTQIPVELTVWDFTLPDRPTCRSSMQLGRYAHSALFPFHKVTSDQDKYDLSRKYTSEVARYKLSVLSPTWQASYWYPGPLPPGPFGYLEVEMPWAVDELNISGYQIGKYSGPSLEGTTLDTGIAEGATFDDRAQFLIDNNWLDLGYMAIDEPQPNDYIGVKNLIDGFRTHQYAKEIKWFGFTYHGDVYDALKGYLDIFTPENNDFGNSLSPIGSAVTPPSAETWAYWTNTAHQWIDAPGITNRLWAPKTQAFGGMGLATWAILIWWEESGRQLGQNPWIEPNTSWGNGVMAYFYPPNPLGTALPAKDMTVVPSLRLLLARDGIEDFEYRVILEKLIQQAETVGINTAGAVNALAMMQRQFATPTSWHLSEAYWADVRTAAAEAIENLLTPRITKISHDQSSGTISISWIALPGRTYQLYYADSLSGTIQWTPAPMSYTITNGIATQDTTDGGTNMRFYKLEVN